MLGRLAMRATVAALGLGGIKLPSASLGAAYGQLQRAAAAPHLLPSARSLFGASCVRNPALGVPTNRWEPHGVAGVAVRSYAYEADSSAAAAAEIEEVDFDPALANTGVPACVPALSCVHSCAPAALQCDMSPPPCQPFACMQYA